MSSRPDEPSTDFNSETHGGGASYTDVRRQAVQWFKIMSDAEISDEDRKLFEQWLARDKAHKAIYDELMKFWGNPYLERALKEKKNSGTLRRRGGRALRRSRKSPFKRLIGAALAVGLLFFAFNWRGDISGDRIQRKDYHTTVGEQRSIVLADGSTVELNTNTRLQVVFDREVRKVALSRGDAYFDVVRDSRPFLVEGGTGLVTVKGTAFEVRVGEGRMVVLVERGRVAVSAPYNGGQYREVTPRRKVAVDHHHLGRVEYQALSDTVADWRDGWLEFHNQALGEVIGELDRYYTGSISLEKPDLSQRPISGKFHVQDFRKSIRNLATIARLDYVTSDTGDIIFTMKSMKDMKNFTFDPACSSC